MLHFERFYLTLFNVCIKLGIGYYTRSGLIHAHRLGQRFEKTLDY